MQHRFCTLARGESLAESMSAYLIDERAGQRRLEGLVLQDQTTRQVETVPPAALVVLVSAEPCTD